MPANKRPYRLNYAVNHRANKSWKKVQSAIAHFKKLQKREQIEGQTKWIQNAFAVVLAKLKKYWINPNKI